jgi:hypothetical protein
LDAIEERNTMKKVADEISAYTYGTAAVAPSAIFARRRFLASAFVGMNALRSRSAVLDFMANQYLEESYV